MRQTRAKAAASDRNVLVIVNFDKDVFVTDGRRIPAFFSKRFYGPECNLQVSEAVCVALVHFVFPNVQVLICNITSFEERMY